MDFVDFVVCLIAIIGIGEAVCIIYLDRKRDADQEIISQLKTKVDHHRILIADLQALIEDDADLDKCLADEVMGEAFERAREVEYEQNRKWYDEAYPGSPWVPKQNPR